MSSPLRALRRSGRLRVSRATRSPFRSKVSVDTSLLLSQPPTQARRKSDGAPVIPPLPEPIDLTSLRRREKAVPEEPPWARLLRHRVLNRDLAIHDRGPEAGGLLEQALAAAGQVVLDG